MQKFIVITGGVMSGVGKGVAAASIGKILKEYGYTVTAIKIDPYLNYDAGTLRPTEHGEVWVTKDGGEIDQDLGNYERFLDIDISKRNNITTGQVYKTVIDAERRGDFLGETVQFIPHIPYEIKKRIKEASKGFEIVIIEIGGTIGDYENLPFLFAVRSLRHDIGKENILYGLITYLPIPTHINEMKTKPTQTAIRLLNEAGIFPDFILCRAKQPLDDVRRRKIEVYANIERDYVISAPDITATIYSIPLNFEKENLGLKILKKLMLYPKKTPDWARWSELVNQIENPERSVKIAIVGKYIDIGDYKLSDSYISINEALKHAGAEHNVGVNIVWEDSKCFEGQTAEDNIKRFANYNGILVPGGFGEIGVEGKINAIRFARENKIPYLGICYGMQLAIVEFARNVCGLNDAHSTEVKKETKYPVIDLLPEQRAVENKGGTMRLGAYCASLKEGTIVHGLYGKLGRFSLDKESIRVFDSFRIGNLSGQNIIAEVHRHRYEQNPDYIQQLESNGIVFSGYHERLDGTRLMEFIEIPGHPFFVATQAHPEFMSRFGKPAPLFYGFVGACKRQNQDSL